MTEQSVASAGDENSALASALASVQLPMLALDLATRRVIASNEALAALFGETAAGLVGQPLDKFIPKEELQTAQRHIGDIAAHRLEGYQAMRHYIVAGGHRAVVQVWVRRLELPGLNDVAAIIVVRGDHQSSDLLPPSLTHEVVAPAFALIVTDHDWRVEHCSRDVEDFLGYQEAAFIRQPLLGLVAPADAPDFLLAVTQAATSRRTVIARVRLRGADEKWRDVCCYLTPLCAHNPPRLGVMLTTSTSVPASTGQSRTPDLEQHLWRIGLEVQAAGVLPEVPRTLATQLSQEFAGLSSRQWEIVTRLLLGERVTDIARAMFLSPSTVRNHLTAIFRKFGVHSQAALLLKLKEASLPRAELVAGGPTSRKGV